MKQKRVRHLMNLETGRFVIKGLCSSWSTRPPHCKPEDDHMRDHGRRKKVDERGNSLTLVSPKSYEFTVYPKFQRIWDLEKTPSLHGGNIRRVIFFPTGSPRLHGTAISAPLCRPSYISKSLCQLYMITFIKSNWLLVCKVGQNITRPRDQPPFFDGILHSKVYLVLVSEGQMGLMVCFCLSSRHNMTLLQCPLCWPTPLRFYHRYRSAKCQAYLPARFRCCVVAEVG